MPLSLIQNRVLEVDRDPPTSEHCNALEWLLRDRLVQGWQKYGLVAFPKTVFKAYTELLGFNQWPP